MTIRSGILPLLLILVLSACSNTRFLADNQLLYTGRGKIEVIPQQPGLKTSEVEGTVRSLTDHKVNNGLLGKRVLPPVGLWTHNYWESDQKKKFGKWLHKTIAAEPVLISDVNPELRAQVIENELFNLGYFNATSWATLDTSRRNPKKVLVDYHVSFAPPFHYDQIRFDTLQGPIDSLIQNDNISKKIKSGDQFNLETLTSMRSQLSRGLQNRGYFYFSPDFFDLKADTTIEQGKLNLIIGRKNELPPSVLSTYCIDKIEIYISKPTLADTIIPDTIKSDGISIISKGDFLKPGLLRDAVFFKMGELYTYTAYQQTITRLNNLGVFNYVRISFEQSASDSMLHLLDVRIDLILANNINLDFEADLVTKSTGYAGPAVMVEVSHGNTFKGAEKVHVGLNGGFEWQWGKKSESQLGTFSYEAGLSSGLTFPKILLPARWISNKPLTTRQTSVNLDFNLLNRTAYYQMFSIMTNLNYRWGQSQKIQHSFSPVYMNQVDLLNTTPEFDSVVNDNIYIRKSFEEQFIIGMRYGFTYDNTYNIKPNNIYFQAAVNTSGNLVDAFAGIGKEATDRPYTFRNSIYSQFVKFTTDVRYYRNGRNKSLVLRLYAGVGLPYGNSTVMPYVEQFFSGGAYSIRGFTARYLGPGSYYEKKSGYIDQSGDIKLEGNLEYRFGLSKILKGAIFLETGNIWLINEDENRPGAKFAFDSFHKELAVGTGVGLRFDFNFFVLRTDLGFPLRNPYTTEGKNWLFNTGKIWSGMLFYLAIGYPF
jgi:outer membrane protein assembly factor BamA